MREVAREMSIEPITRKTPDEEFYVECEIDLGDGRYVNICGRRCEDERKALTAFTVMLLALRETLGEHLGV